MFFRKKTINCQENVDIIKHITKKRFVDSRDFKEINNLLSTLKSTFEENIKHNANLSEFELNCFSSFCNKIDECIRCSNREEINEITKLFDDSLKILEKVYSNSVCFLIRHPDPNPLSYAEQAYKNLSSKGMTEAVGFANSLVEEILLCPKRVNVHIFYTSKKRTELFGNIVAKKLDYIKANNNKDIKILESREENILVTPAIKETIKQYPESKEIFDKIQKGGMNAELRKKAQSFLMMWVENSSSSRECGHYLKELIDNYVKYDSSESWNIFLLFTHDVTIATYMHHVLGFKANESFVDTSEFIKKNKWGFSYKNKWY